MVNCETRKFLVDTAESEPLREHVAAGLIKSRIGKGREYQYAGDLQTPNVRVSKKFPLPCLYEQFSWLDSKSVLSRIDADRTDQSLVWKLLLTLPLAP